jgi:hypothetical protein
MDCDDQVRLVKGKHDSDADTVDVADKARLPCLSASAYSGLATTRSQIALSGSAANALDPPASWRIPSLRSLKR